VKSERLTIQGLLRFNDRVSLDLRDLPPGLIAFVGGNGEGKTTMLETGVASWFRQLPSREKPLVDYVSRADGFIEHQFELEGQGVYTARVNLDGPHRVSEAVLTRVLPDGSTVFLNDGKLKTFDAAIAELLPPQAILLASVFAAQNRNGAFSKLDRKGKAELLSSLLGLNHLAALSAKAKLAAGVVQVEIEKLTARRDVLSRGGETVETDLEQRAQRLQAEGGQLEADKRLLGHDIRGVEQRLTLVAEASARHAVATARAGLIVVEIAARTAEETRAAADLQDVDLSLMRDLDVAQTDLTARLSALDAEARDTSVYEKERRDADLVKASTDRAADERIENNRSYLADAEGIRAAARAVEETDTAIATFRKELGKLGAEVSAHLNTERAHLQALRDIEDAERGLAKAESDLVYLNDVPCKGEGPYMGCAFLLQAAGAKVRIPALQDLIAPKDEISATLTALRIDIANTNDTIAAIQEGIRELEDSHQTLKVEAGKLPALAQAEERIASLTQRKADAVVTHARAHEEAGAREGRRLEDLAARRLAREQEHTTDVARLKARAEERRTALTAQLARLHETLWTLGREQADVAVTVILTEDASATAAEQTTLLSLKRQEWDRCVSALARVEAERQELARRIEEERARREEVARVDEQLTAHRRDVGEWTLLAKALGRDGLPVLEIDAAGPTISALANDLMQACYGGRFTLDLVTQVARTSKGKDGDAFKDALDVLLFDAERGGAQRDLSDLSGGEQVIVDEVLRSAIALFLTQRSQTPLRTLWRDECTGALDQENGPRYIAMLRRLQALGGFHHIIAIIHTPEWAEMADAQVRFAGGQVTVEMAPYGRTEAA